MEKNMMQGTSADIKNIEMENRSAGYDALGQIEEALEGEEYRTAYEPLLCCIFPFRLTEDTLRAGCNMDLGEWEEFTFKLAKVLHFAKQCNGKKNISENLLLNAAAAMRETIKIIRLYMDRGKID